MEVRSYIVISVIGCALATIFSRVTPLVLFSKFKISDNLNKWLRHIPIAILSALLASSLLLVDGKIAIDENLLIIIASIPACIIAAKTKSLILTAVSGIIVLMALRFLTAHFGIMV